MTEPPVPHFWGTLNATVEQESGLTHFEDVFQLVVCDQPQDKHRNVEERLQS